MLRYQSGAVAQALEKKKEEDQELAMESFVKVATCASHSCKLGIFSLECAHRYNQSVSEASSHLGRAKGFPLIAANAVLNSTLQKHKALVKKRGPQELVATSWQVMNHKSEHLTLILSSLNPNEVRINIQSNQFSHRSCISSESDMTIFLGGPDLVRSIGVPSSKKKDRRLVIKHVSKYSKRKSGTQQTQAFSVFPMCVITS